MALVTPVPRPALAGIRVVELADGVPGPFAARLLAEAGADVVKVEPVEGDAGRGRLPAGFATWNRSKRSVVLSVDQADGRDRLHDLLGRADVFLHDLPAATAAAMGLDDETLTSRHPHLVVASVPPYPRGHPREGTVAGETLIQAAEGLMDEQQGNREGPIFVRIPYGSWSAGYLLATGAVARLVQRARTGAVLPISTSLLQGALTTAALYWQRWERLPATLSRHTLPKIDPDAALSIFECSDGRWIQLAGAVGGWIESPPVLEALALADRVDLSEVGVTRANQPQWNDVFRARDSIWWRDILSSHDVPVMIVHELGECFTSDQALVNDYVVEVDDPVLGRAWQAGPTVRTTPQSAVTSPAPALGSTSVDQVLGEWEERGTEAPEAPADPGEDPRPLAGLRALDFGSAIAGPYGAQCLADLGADVIKVEPVRGDRGRQLTQFAGAHRGKRSLAIDLKSADARPVLDRLLRSSDIVLHNMRLGPASRLGLDGPGLRAVNPGIVFSHVSAYGTDGEMAALPGYDPTAQALTGWEHANAGDGMRPMWLRNSVFDVHAGLASCFGAVVSVLQRERDGVPGEAGTSLLAVGITAASELVVHPDGSRSAVEVLSADQTGVSDTHRIYALADGWIAVAALADVEQAAFWEAIGGSDVKPAEALAARSVADVLDHLTAAGVPCTPVRLGQLDAFHDDRACRELGLSRHLHTHDFGEIDLVGGFWSFGPAPATESVPALGEHSLDILTELGCPVAEVESLVGARTVVAGSPSRQLQPPH